VDASRRGKYFCSTGFMAGMEPPTMLRLSSRTHHIRARTVLSGGCWLVDGLAVVYGAVSTDWSDPRC